MPTAAKHSAVSMDLFDLEQFKKHATYICFRDLIALGCTSTLIERFLGTPDLRKASPRSRSPLCLYDKERVRQAFSTDEARAACQESIRRRQLCNEARNKREAVVTRRLERMMVSVRVMAPPQLRLASFRWLKAHAIQCVFTRATPQVFLQERYLARREYLYVRHMLTDFERATDIIKGCKPKQAFEQLLVRTFNEQIVQTYPQLAWPAEQAEDEPLSYCPALAVAEMKPQGGERRWSSCAA